MQSLHSLWPSTTAADGLLTLRPLSSSGGKQHGHCLGQQSSPCAAAQARLLSSSGHVSPGQADVHFAMRQAPSLLTRLHIRTNRPLTSSGGRQQVLYVQEGIST